MEKSERFDFSPFIMENRYDSVIAVTSEEIDRRWSLLKGVMADRNVDAAVLISYRPGEMRGIHQWLAGSKRIEYIIFPGEGTPVAVFGGEPNSDGSFNRNAQPGCGQLPTGFYGRVDYVNSLSPDKAAALLGNSKRIGIYKSCDLTVAIRDTILSAAPGAELVDITAEVDRVKASRSQLDIQLTHEAALMCQRVHETLPNILKRGRTYVDVMADTIYAGLQNGSSAEVMMFINENFDSHGDRLMPERVEYPGPRYKDGDIVGMLIESDSWGGYNSMTDRYYCFGQPAEDFKIRFETADKANLLVGSLLKEGATVRETAETVNQFIRDSGYYTDDCNYLHSCGYATWEDPSKSDRSIRVPNIFDSENWPLKAGQQLMTHPHVGPIGGAKVDRSRFVRCGSSWVVGKDGATRSNDIQNQYIVV
jgi:Xaa-Pro aminopeptidase